MHPSGSVLHSSSRHSKIVDGALPRPTLASEVFQPLCCLLKRQLVPCRPSANELHLKQNRQSGLIRVVPHACRFDEELSAFAVRIPSSSASSTSSSSDGTNSNSGSGSHNSVEEFYLDPATVRRADTSAASINEWTGERMSRDADVADDVRPASIGPLGNYAVSFHLFSPSSTAQLGKLLGAKCPKSGKSVA